MQKIFFTILVAFACNLGFAQNHHHNTTFHSGFICSYYGEPINMPVTAFSPAADAKAVITSIIDVVGLEPKFELKGANIPNAAAVISSGKRYILYNPNFMNAIDQATKDSWASIAILAHEIGHHLNGHTLLGNGSRPDIELEADQFSGFVLRKMGANLDQAQKAMQIIASEKASATHPAKNNRLISIANGWNKAESQISGKTYVAKAFEPSPVQTRTSSAATTQTRTTIPSPRTVADRRYVLDSRYVKYDVVFAADRENNYHITTQDNLVTIRNNNLLVMGKLIKIANSRYPYAIHKDGKVVFFMDANGNILSPSGQAIGYIRKQPRA